MNVILIISDTFRYDNLFGGAGLPAGDLPPVRTPNLDAFAKRAVSFSKLYASGFPTVSHRRNLISGRLWPWPAWTTLPPGPQNIMPRLLKETGGYVTQFLGDCPHLFGAGFKQYFDAAHVLRGQEGDVHFLRMNRPIEHAMPAEKTRTTGHFQGRNLVDLHRWSNSRWRGEEDRFCHRVADLAVEWVEENYRYHPFFLWVDFFDPHEPWDPPEFMVRHYDPDYTGPPMLHPNYGRAGDLSVAELENLVAHYRAEAELVDRQIGRLLQRIDDLELWDDTVVMFTTDHGTSLGEHDRTGKGNRNAGDDRLWPPYPEVGHIPLLVAGPMLPGGESIACLAEPTDILPTLLELIGLSADLPETFHGQSVAAQLCGQSGSQDREIVMTGAMDFLAKAGCTEPPVFYTERWAFAPIGAGGEPELYDLEVDPAVERNVVGENAGVERSMRTTIRERMKALGVPAEVLRELKI